MQTARLANKTPISLIIGASFRRIVEGARLLMVDLGISGFIEMIESHFGRWVAKAILLLILLTIVAFCLDTLNTLVIQPLLSSINAVLEAQTFSLSSYWDLIRNGVILILVVALSLSLAKNYRWRKTAQEDQKAIDEITAEIEKVLDDPASKKLMERATEKLNDKTS